LVEKRGVIDRALPRPYKLRPVPLSPAPVSSARSHHLLRLLAFVAFISLGLPDGVLGVAWPSVQRHFSLPVSRLGVLLTAAVCGSLLSSTFAGQVVRAIGVGKLLFVSSLLVAGAMTGMATSPFWHGMVTAAFFSGLGAGAIDAGINAFAASRFSPRLVTWLHACYGIGATGGPVLMTISLYTPGGWRLGYGVVAGLLAAMATLFAFTLSLWNAPPPEDTGDALPHGTHLPGDAGMLETVVRPAVWMQVLLFFVYAGAEVTAGQWLFTLLTESRGVTPASAGTIVGMYWASLTFGRIVFGQLATRFAPRAILRFATFLAPLAALLIAKAPVPVLSAAGAVLLGFALAPIFPLLISATPTRVGQRYAAQSIGFQISAATIGVAVLPGIAGVLARDRGLETVPMYLIGITLLLLVLHEVAMRIPFRTEARVESP
jgi:fucose permease